MSNLLISKVNKKINEYHYATTNHWCKFNCPFGPTDDIFIRNNKDTIRNKTVSLIFICGLEWRSFFLSRSYSISTKSWIQTEDFGRKKHFGNIFKFSLKQMQKSNRQSKEKSKKLEVFTKGSKSWLGKISWRADWKWAVICGRWLRMFFGRQKWRFELRRERFPALNGMNFGLHPDCNQDAIFAHFLRILWSFWEKKLTLNTTILTRLLNLIFDLKTIVVFAITWGTTKGHKK